MQRLIRKAMAWAYGGDTFVAKWRRERMEEMVQRLKLPPCARVVDLGGDEWIWTLFEHNYHITLVNLPGRKPPVSNPDRFTLVQGDACDLSEMFADNAFDLAFSNSVIEHVGDPKNQERFAHEVRRLAPAYWVQTPSDRFPLEPHTGVPFYWKLPGPLKRWLNSRWRRDMPDFWQMVAGTTVLSRRRMQQLFPDGQVFLERKLGFEKSYAMYRARQPDSSAGQCEGRACGAECSDRSLQVAQSH